jgi:hypothetical protein
MKTTLASARKRPANLTLSETLVAGTGQGLHEQPVCHHGVIAGRLRAHPA